MLLAIVGVGFEERDVMSAFRESANDAAIIRGRAVPKSGYEARTEKHNAQVAFHWEENQEGASAPGVSCKVASAARVRHGALGCTCLRFCGGHPKFALTQCCVGELPPELAEEVPSGGLWRVREASCADSSVG